MGKKPLIIREINMRKVPGFPSGIIAIKGLARNINLVAGPNASGKSTTAKAIRQVLWPQDFKKQDIECRLELEGQLWDIRLDHGDYHSQRGGIDDKLPHLPAVEESKRYSLALHELVKDDDTDLAIQVGREMSGGFNLPQAEQNLGFDAKFKPRTISERKAYGEAEEKVRKIEAGQVQLKDREQKLENLQAEKAKALQARTWEKLFTAASACTEARAAFGELSDRLKLFPEQLAMMRGNEADELDGLEKDINNYTKKVEQAQEDAEKKKTQLRSLDLPDVGIDKQLLDELDTRVIAVLDIEKELNRLAVETSTAEQALVHALRSISKELEHKGEINIQLSDVAALEKFLSDAHRVMSEKQVLESNLAAAMERAKSVSVSNDQLNEGIRLLILWFKEPEGTAQNKAPWLWALVAAGILTALAVYFLGWLGLVGGIILVVLGVLGGRTETGNQADIRRKDYQRTGLAQPKNWDNEEVLRVLNELTGQLQAGKNAEMAQQEIAIYEADLEKVTARELVVNEQRDNWLEKLAFVPELPKADLKNYGGLYWCLLALRDYQLAYSELAAAQSASTTLQKQQGEQFLAINSLLDGLHAPVHSGPAARASHKKLVEDEMARQRLAEAIGEIAGHIGEWQAEKNRAAAKLAALFQRLEIPEGNNEELYDLLEQLESYQVAAKKCEEKQFELKDRTAQLESHEWYEKIREEIDGLTVENARLKEQQHKTEADKLDHLNEQITGIVTLIAEAMKGHVLEDALADRESALENLENAYEKNLAALTGSLIGSKLKETSRASRNSDVFDRANRLFNRITNGRYELLIDDTNAAAFKALDTASNQGQELSILSTGTRIQLLLSVRLAFIESQEKDIKLPVMADEILANSDDQRAQQIIEALVEISKEGRQVNAIKLSTRPHYIKELFSIRFFNFAANHSCIMSVNTEIINDLKSFIAQSATQTELKELFTNSKTDFSRNRKLGFERLVLLLINFFRKSYSIEIAEFYNWLEIDELTVSKSAFCQQRMKIKELFFACLNEVLVQSFYEHYGQDIKCWNGMRVIAVDGSIINLIHYDEVINHFGTHSNNSEKKFPMGQALSAYDILNGIAIRTELYPVKISEQRMAQHWIQYYEPDMLLIYDRGYPGFISFFLHQNKELPQPFVMRCPLRFTYEIRDFVSSNNNDTIVSFRANKYSSDELHKHGFVVPIDSTINIRLIKVILDDGTIEVLATNLFNKQDYPQEIFKELYFMRWGIETNFNAIKNQLQLEAFSGQRVTTIMQDFYITFFLSNLQAIIAKSCEKEIELITSERLHHYKINRNIAFGIMKNRIVDLLITHNPEKILNDLQELFIHHLEPVRPYRKYPHCRKNSKSRSKYEALTNYKRAI